MSVPDFFTLISWRWLSNSFSGMVAICWQLEDCLFEIPRSMSFSSKLFHIASLNSDFYPEDWTAIQKISRSSIFWVSSSGHTMLPPSQGLQVFLFMYLLQKKMSWKFGPYFTLPWCCYIQNVCKGLSVFIKFGDSGKEFQPPCLNYRYFRQFLEYQQDWFY